MKEADFVLVDVSNTFTKIVFASRTRLGAVQRIPTAALSLAALRQVLGSRRARHAVVASVVPEKNKLLARVLPALACWVTAEISLGIEIEYPKSATIGADRLANVVAARHLYGTPAVVADFGTAVTFDVLNKDGAFIGGVIAPGLRALTDYLHERTALLPRVEPREPRRAIGRSTRASLQAGAVFGYRGLVKEILRSIQAELPRTPKPLIIATGGDARFIAGQTRLFTHIVPTLTLEGLRLIGGRNFPES